MTKSMNNEQSTFQEGKFVESRRTFLKGTAYSIRHLKNGTALQSLMVMTGKEAVQEEMVYRVMEILMV